MTTKNILTKDLDRNCKDLTRTIPVEGSKQNIPPLTIKPSSTTIIFKYRLIGTWFDLVVSDSEWIRNTTELEVYLGHSHNPWGASTNLKEMRQARGKRSVVHLYNMVLCATGCNPLSYKGYGCYCGFLGSGYPTDPIDRCCKMHDWCYNSADCPMFLEYFVPYVWTCYKRRPLCGVGSSCGQRLCECDRLLAKCLSRYGCPRTKSVCTSSPWRLLQNLIML